MKKIFYLPLIVFVSMFSSILAAKVIPDADLNIDALPHCAPTRLSNNDAPLEAILQEIDRLPKYYLSQLIGLSEEEEPPYQALSNPSHFKKELEAFAFKMMQIADEDDACDRVGILYVARFHWYFCPSQSAYNNLGPESQKVVKSFLLWNENVMQKARNVSGCQF
ncbi:MAG: hypothetical protein I8H75_00395 [Myxococcaceae bacterium]|nr:hypothetical protein [Myxococcaceae bacterium]MBH2005804.1 hypothetical protein [Myxococcaceae bacterium]